MSAVSVPSSRPQLSAQKVHEHIAHIEAFTYPIVVLGIRGYYLNTQGAVGVNDRGIYDDAIFLKTNNNVYAFNGNTDPSHYRKGHGTGKEKGMATLMPGTYYCYHIGMHNGKYIALVQTAGEVTVVRDGDPPYEDKGYFGINCHKGYFNSTSSEGCQTIYKPQWDEFIGHIITYCKLRWPAEWAAFEAAPAVDPKTKQRKLFKLLTIPYVLVEQQ